MPATKKPAAKKSTTAKKPVTKKATPKKSATKKTAATTAAEQPTPVLSIRRPPAANKPIQCKQDSLGAKPLIDRLNRHKAHNSTDLKASLIWNDIADLDLSCITPDGERIYFGHRNSQCGGWLDVDMNVISSAASTEPVENIFWASAPSGKFQFRVTNYSCHIRENTVFTDSGRAVPFRLFVTKGGETEVFDGTVTQSEGAKLVHACDHNGCGALGSFVTMPTHPSKKITFKDACETHGVTYMHGNGYYCIAKSENISAKKDLLLHDLPTDTFTIGAEKVRSQLGWPVNEAVQKSRKHLPPDTRLYVQSTSSNRGNPPRSHVLMKTSVEEALRHRGTSFTSVNQSHS